MLTVNLAGYNVDTDVLEQLQTGTWQKKQNVTPETISAAYARISRDPRPVNELRVDAREEVDKSRKSNENIVFKMGHHSVAEHAYLNFDILGLSRLGVEYLQEARLCSYTEKSQRYITLEGDYVKPVELKGKAFDLFEKTVKLQVEAYKKAFPLLHEYQKEQGKEFLGTKSGANMVEGWAKEDARYMLSIATECQLGFSTNARNLERIIRKLRNSPFNETKELGNLLFERAKTVVPSLIILSDPEAFKKQFGFEVADGIIKTGAATLKKLAADNLGKPETFADEPLVTLISHTENPDTAAAAALLYAGSGISYEKCAAKAAELEKSGKLKGFFAEAFADVTAHDALFRELENVNLVFEMSISSSAFAQMKRHRMMTIIKQDYNPSLGVTMPPSIAATGQQGLFDSVIEATDKAYTEIAKEAGTAAMYALTNAHRRRILVNTNLRELYHITRLRMDKHAQWDIRQIAAAMAKLARNAAPLSAGLACGKDTFPVVREEYFKRG